MNYMYEVVVAAGCHRQPTNPVVSRHRSLRAAVAAARRNDRLAVEPANRRVTLYTAEPRGDGRGSHGRYGRGPLRGEPSLDSCVRAALEEAAR